MSVEGDESENGKIRKAELGCLLDKRVNHRGSFGDIAKGLDDVVPAERHKDKNHQYQQNDVGELCLEEISDHDGHLATGKGQQ